MERVSLGCSACTRADHEDIAVVDRLVPMAYMFRFAVVIGTTLEIEQMTKIGY